METTVHEIAKDTYRLSTYVPDVGPTGLSFNQYLLVGEEPLLFHTGMRGLFGTVSRAVARVMPVDRLRWISFGHVESDECGAMNLFLAAAPKAEIAFNPLGCAVQLDDLADRPPQPLQPGERVDIGGHVVEVIATPHVPHAWEAQVMFDHTTKTMFCGDLFSQGGNPPALVHDVDVISPTLEFESMFGYSTFAPSTEATVRGLAAYDVRTLGLMHGPAYAGDAPNALRELAGSYAARVNAVA